MATEHPVFAWFYEVGNRPIEWLARNPVRARLVEGLRGRVLEVGAGNGLNFRYYAPDARVIAIEPDRHMLLRAVPRMRSAKARIELFVGDGQALPFRPRTFDAVVACLVLCTIPDALAALAEMRRVLKPDGVLRFFEHVRARADWLARAQDAIDPLWTRTMGGCHMNRATADVIARAGFRIDRIKAGWQGIMVRGEAAIE
jgi:ubiquinone/menaquinone biosynthesis C-methylase UbiE